MPGATRKYKVRRVAIEKTTEPSTLNQPLTWGLHKEQKMTERWEKELYGKVKAVTGMGIGGQMPGSGTDVLKYIKQHDPQNSSGAVKDSLDIMLKFQESVRAGDLLKNVQPLQSILGGMYGKFSSISSAAHAAAKTKKKKQKTTVVAMANVIANTVFANDIFANALLANVTINAISNTVTIVETVEEDLGVVGDLIDAAITKISPDDAIDAAEALNDDEIAKIEDAYYNNGVYASTLMPALFVSTINYLMPIFRATRGTGPGTGVV